MLPEKADWQQIGLEVRRRLQALVIPEACTPESLDVVAEGFLEASVDVVHNSVPRARPSPHAKRWWTTDLTLLRRSLSSARNYVTTLRRRGVDTIEAQRKFQASRKEYLQQIEKQKKRHWRDFLLDPSHIWKANRFARTASQGTCVPKLHLEERTAETDEEKANMLMDTFFPIPDQPELHGGAPHTEKRAGTGKVPQDLPRITEEEIRKPYTGPTRGKRLEQMISRRS